MKNERRHTSDDDAVHVAAWRKGDLSAFEVLVGKYQKRMLNVAYRITGDYEKACEVVQDAFVAAYREIDSLRGAARFPTWLTALVVVHSRNRSMQEQAHEGAHRSPVTPGAEVAGPPLAVAVANVSVPDQRGQDDMQRHVQACISSLVADFREVLVLRDLQQIPCSEIGAILKIREAAVKSRLFQAREMLKDCMTRAVGEL